MKTKILVLSTPFDSDSLHLLLDLGVDYIKIASGDLTTYSCFVKWPRLINQLFFRQECLPLVISRLP